MDLLMNAALGTIVLVVIVLLLGMVAVMIGVALNVVTDGRFEHWWRHKTRNWFRIGDEA